MISQRSIRKFLGTINLTLVGLIISNTTAQAAFNFVYQPGTDPNIIEGFTKAGDILSDHFNDDIGVNIYVGAYGLNNTNALGGTRPSMVRVKYGDYLNHYLQDITSADDLSVLQNLQMDADDKNQIQSILQGKTPDQVTASEINDLKNLINFDKNSNFSIINYKNKIKNNNKYIWLTRANARALGLLPKQGIGFDAQIMISNQYNWDYTRVSDPTVTTIAADKYDFLSVALHETLHAMGFMSGVDAFKTLNSVAASNETSIAEGEDSKYISPLDMVRYSEGSKNSQIADFSEQGDKYFSIDGGQTNLGNFDGKNYQTSHWEAATTLGDELGIMNPTIRKGQVLNISDLDLKALDVMGWDSGSSNLLSSSMEGILGEEDENDLRDTSIFDSAISRFFRGSTFSWTRFWQERWKNKSIGEYNTLFMEISEYTESMDNSDLVESASLPVELHQMLAIQAYEQNNNHDHNHNHVSVPEPNMIGSLGIMGILGMGHFFQHRRKSNHN